MGIVAQNTVELSVAENDEVLKDEKLVYLFKDILGTTVRAFDETGTCVQECGFEPFGKEAFSEEFGGSTELSRSFTGHFKESDDGLYYCHARWYDADIGRFLQADSVLDGLNRYCYCGNNPVGCCDPTGEVGVDLLKKLKNIPRIIDNTTSFVNNYTSPLSGQSKFSSESDYKKQYTTISENEAANLRVVSIVGQLPGALGFAATVLGTGASTNSTNNEEVVVFNQRLSFIDGAEKEIERIDEVSKWLKDDPSQKGFVDYLSDQKQILQNEINKNKEYDKKEQKLDNGYNRSHSEESWAKGTDYVNS